MWVASGIRDPGSEQTYARAQIWIQRGQKITGSRYRSATLVVSAIDAFGAWEGKDTSSLTTPLSPPAGWRKTRSFFGTLRSGQVEKWNNVKFISICCLSWEQKCCPEMQWHKVHILSRLDLFGDWCSWGESHSQILGPSHQGDFFQQSQLYTKRFDILILAF